MSKVKMQYFFDFVTIVFITFVLSSSLLSTTLCELSEKIVIEFEEKETQNNLESENLDKIEDGAKLLVAYEKFLIQTVSPNNTLSHYTTPLYSFESTISLDKPPILFA